MRGCSRSSSSCSRPCCRCEVVTMAITGVSSNAAIMTQQLINLRSQLDDLQQQLGTGQKYTDYSGVSSQAQLLVGLNSQLSAITSFQNSNSVLNARLSIAQT